MVRQKSFTSYATVTDHGPRTDRQTDRQLIGSGLGSRRTQNIFTIFFLQVLSHKKLKYLQDNRPSLTKEEVSTILETWKVVQEHTRMLGYDMFIRWVYKKCHIIKSAYTGIEHE